MSAEGVRSVSDTDQAGPARVGAADAVVADVQGEQTGVDGGLDGNDAGVGVFGGVRESFRGDEVSGFFDGGCEPRQVNRPGFSARSVVPRAAARRGC